MRELKGAASFICLEPWNSHGSNVFTQKQENGDFIAVSKEAGDSSVSLIRGMAC